MFAILKQRQPDLYLVLAGEGPSLSCYEKLAAAYNLKDRVMFLPFLNRKDIRTLLSHCEMAVFPSSYEPFGLAAQESMEQGVLTVVSQSGGFVIMRFMTKRQSSLILRSYRKLLICWTVF